MCIQLKEPIPSDGLVLLPPTAHAAAYWTVVTLCFCGSGEAALPEGNPSGAARPRVALPVGRKGEERAESRKVSGQRYFCFTSFYAVLGIL